MYSAVMMEDRTAAIGWGEIKGAKRLPSRLRAAIAMDLGIGGDRRLETLETGRWDPITNRAASSGVRFHFLSLR